MPRPDGDSVDYRKVQAIAKAIEKLMLIDKWNAFAATDAQDLINKVAQLETSPEFTAITKILIELGVTVRTDEDAAKVNVAGADKKKAYKAVRNDINAFQLRTGANRQENDVMKTADASFNEARFSAHMSKILAIHTAVVNTANNKIVYQIKQR